MRVFALLALLLPCIACDQATKILAVDHLKGAAPVEVVAGFFRLTYAENPGAFLSLGRSLPEGVRQAVLIGIVAVMLLGVSWVLLRKHLPPLAFVGLGLLLAGGLGNLIDRVARDGGRVVDFAVLRAGPLQTGVFNVADVQIVAAALLLAFAGWFGSKHQKQEEAGSTFGSDSM
jgi:signal peptidase II